LVYFPWKSILIGMHIDFLSHIIQYKYCFIANRMTWLRVRVMVCHAIFNNTSVISWWSVLLMEKSGVPVENHRLAADN